jgi:hypothetical protein
LLASIEQCSLVWGMDSSYGNVNRKMSFKGQDLQTFLTLSQSKCGNGPVAVISTYSQDPNDEPGGWDMSFCLVYKGDEAACGTNQGYPFRG